MIHFSSVPPWQPEICNIHIAVYIESNRKESSPVIKKKGNVLKAFLCLQTMAATKRNAGLTSAVPRATLNDEELVSLNVMNKSFCRGKYGCIPKGFHFPIYRASIVREDCRS